MTEQPAITLPGLGTLAVTRSRGSGPVSDFPEIRDELLRVVRAKYEGTPRNLQTTMGPSGVGHPCARSLVFDLSGRTPPRDPFHDPWPSIVGTAVHTWLDEALVQYGDGHWLSDHVIYTGSRAVPSGHLDAHHIPSQTVIDFKVLGNTTYDSAAKHAADDTYWSPGSDGGQYFIQLQTYGYGLVRAGFPVRRVGLAVFGRAKKLTNLFIRGWQYREDMATWALRRAEAAQMLAAGGLDPLAVPANPTSKGCHYCPWKGSEADGLCDRTTEG